MKQLEMAQQLHQELDSQYAARLFKASANGWAKAVTRFTELRRINDGAYFLIIFAAFERVITDFAETAIRVRSSRPAYHQRRAWDTISNRPHFKDKVRLVLDQRTAQFATITNYYEVRNQLAHKGVTTITFSIPNVVADLKAARKSMKK